jgi:hypothetical protein
MMVAGSSSNGGAGGTGGDPVATMLIDVRAGTAAFASDLAAMRGTVDGTLASGFDAAGKVLEGSLTGAIRKGDAAFLDLRTMAIRVIDDIAAQAVKGLFSGLLGSASGGGGIGAVLGSLGGLPGRATGGPVSPGAAYVVGERGPELFVPTSAGSVAANGGTVQPAREVRVSITVNAPAGGDQAQALQRSSRQVASAVRRALAQA